MSFPRYQEYKLSGFGWLREVPAHWIVGALGYHLKERPCYGVLVPDFDPNGVPMLRITDIDNGTIDRESLTRISEALSNQYSRTLVRPDDVVLSVVGTIGKCVVVDGELGGVNLSRALARLTPTSDLLPRWLLWVFQSEPFRLYVDLTCVGAAQRVLNMDDLRAFRIPAPGRSEQIAIVEFVDREAAKIDALVAEQEKLITLLREKRQELISHAVIKGLDPAAPMKDSGIEWLGKVPAHWSVLRIGALFHEAADIGNEELPILSVSIHDGVSDKELDEAELDRKVSRSEDRSKYKAVRPGDLAYNMMRAWQGGFGAVTVNGQVSPAYIVARPLREVRTAFVEQILRTPQAVEQMRRYSRGVTDFRLRLYWQEFKNLRIALPSVEEQQAILEEISAEANKFDALIAEANRAIELLKERRSALISDAVTGKIDVRGAVSRSCQEVTL